MTKLEKEQIDRLCGLTTATMADKTECESVIQKWIQPGYKFCKTCDPQVKAAFKKLKSWWSDQITDYRFIKTKE
jgi:hypothetical protein